MSNPPTKPLKLSAAMLMLLASSACATLEPQRTVSSGCLVFRPISFAQLPAEERAKGEAAQDPGNTADSDPTVAEITEHNARYDATCPQAAER